MLPSHAAAAAADRPPPHRCSIRTRPSQPLYLSIYLINRNTILWRYPVSAVRRDVPNACIYEVPVVPQHRTSARDAHRQLTVNHRQSTSVKPASHACSLSRGPSAREWRRQADGTMTTATTTRRQENDGDGVENCFQASPETRQRQKRAFRWRLVPPHISSPPLSPPLHCRC